MYFASIPEMKISLLFHKLFLIGQSVCCFINYSLWDNQPVILQIIPYGTISLLFHKLFLIGQSAYRFIYYSWLENHLLFHKLFLIGQLACCFINYSLWDNQPAISYKLFYNTYLSFLLVAGETTKQLAK